MTSIKVFRTSFNRNGSAGLLVLFIALLACSEVDEVMRFGYIDPTLEGIYEIFEFQQKEVVGEEWQRVAQLSSQVLDGLKSGARWGLGNGQYAYGTSSASLEMQPCQNSDCSRVWKYSGFRFRKTSESWDGKSETTYRSANDERVCFSEHAILRLFPLEDSSVRIEAEIHREPFPMNSSYCEPRSIVPSDANYVGSEAVALGARTPGPRMVSP